MFLIHRFFPLLPGIFFGALFATVMVAASPALATQPDVYRVAAVEVSGKGANATQAKERAIAAGRARAFATLLRRLTLPEDADRLPTPSAAEMREAEEGFEVVEEKGGATTYSGSVSYRFNPARVRAVLERGNVPFVDARSQPVLVLAVWRDGDTPVLWDDPNPWRVAWDRFEPESGLVPFIKARGDLEDLQKMSAGQADGMDRVAMGDMARRYSATTVLVAVGRTSGNGVSVSVEAFNVAMERHEQIGTYTGAKSDEGFRRIAADMLAAYEGRWKKANLVPTGPTETLLVDAPLDGLDYWIRLRERLGQVALVRGTRVISLSPRLAVLELTFAGGVARMVEVASQNGLQMERREAMVDDPDAPRERWLLRMGGGGGPVGGPTVREIPIPPPDPVPGDRDDDRDRDNDIRGGGDGDVDTEWRGVDPTKREAPRRP